MEKLEYLKVQNIVYQFNHKNKTVSAYVINYHGFLYSVERRSDVKFEQELMMLKNNAKCTAFAETEYREFCGHLEAIQKNANSLVPIIPFEQHLTALVKKFEIDLIIPD